MRNEIEAMITDITATTAEAEDYTGEDGLLYCGKCHTPKEAYFSKETAQWLGHDRHPAECDCQRAKNIPTLEDSGASRHCAYLVVDQVNPGLTDLFTRQFRKVAQEQQKSSVLQKLKQELPAHKSAAPKKREPER